MSCGDRRERSQTLREVTLCLESATIEGRSGALKEAVLILAALPGRIKLGL